MEIYIPCFNNLHSLYIGFSYYILVQNIIIKEKQTWNGTNDGVLLHYVEEERDEHDRSDLFDFFPHLVGECLQ